MKYEIKTLTNEEFDSLPYERVMTSCGVTDRLLGVSYIRDTGDVDFDVDTVLHEIQEMENKVSPYGWSHEDKYGVRYRNFFRAITNPFKEIGGYLEKTFLPEGVKSTLQKTPIVGDIMSRGWLGPTIQQFTNEGREAEAKDIGTARAVNRATGAAILTAGLSGLGGAAGLTLPGFGPGGMFSGGAGAGTAGATGSGTLAYGGGASAGGSAGMWAPTISSGTTSAGAGSWIPSLAGNAGAINSALSAMNPSTGGSSIGGGGNLSNISGGGGNVPLKSSLDQFNVGSNIGKGINATKEVATKTPSWWQTGLGKLGIGAATTLAGQFMGPKTPEVPTSRFATMMEQGGLQPRTAIGQQAMAKASELLAQNPQGLSEEYKNAIMADFDKQDAEEERVLKQTYKSLRPYADVENDSAYNKDLAELKQEQQEYRKNTLAKLEQANEESNKNFQRQDIMNAMGIDEQTFNEYASLANQDLNTIMLQTGIDYGQAQQFKDMFGKLGAMFISSGMGLNNSNLNSFVQPAGIPIPGALY